MNLVKHLAFVAVYLDDIPIFSKTAEEHLEHIKAVLQILKESKLYCKLKKCESNQTVRVIHKGKHALGCGTGYHVTWQVMLGAHLQNSECPGWEPAQSLLAGSAY